MRYSFLKSKLKMQTMQNRYEKTIVKLHRYAPMNARQIEVISK